MEFYIERSVKKKTQFGSFVRFCYINYIFTKYSNSLFYVFNSTSFFYTPKSKGISRTNYKDLSLLQTKLTSPAFSRVNVLDTIPIFGDDAKESKEVLVWGIVRIL